MKGNRKKYNPLQQLSAVFMIMALLWLTISAPFVIAAQQKIAQYDKTANSVPRLQAMKRKLLTLLETLLKKKLPAALPFPKSSFTIITKLIISSLQFRNTTNAKMLTLMSPIMANCWCRHPMQLNLNSRFS